MFILAKPDLSLDAPWYDQWIALIGFLVVAMSGLAYLVIAKPDGASTAPQGDAIEVGEKIRQFS